MGDFVASLLPYTPDYWCSSATLVHGTNLHGRSSQVVKALTHDLRIAGGAGQFLIAATIAAWAFEWGPFNELTAAYVSLESLRITGNSAIAGLTGGFVYASQQCVVGLITAMTIGRMASGTQAFRREFNTESPSGASMTDRLTLLLGWGASALIVNEHARQSGRTISRDVSLLAIALAGLIVIDTAVFWGATYALNSVADDSFRGLLLGLATNPLTYIVAFTAIKIASYQRKLSRAARAESTTPA